MCTCVLLCSQLINVNIRTKWKSLFPTGTWDVTVTAPFTCSHPCLHSSQVCSSLFSPWPNIHSWFLQVLVSHFKIELLLYKFKKTTWAFFSGNSEFQAHSVLIIVQFVSFLVRKLSSPYIVILFLPQMFYDIHCDYHFRFYCLVHLNNFVKGLHPVYDRLHLYTFI